MKRLLTLNLLLGFMLFTTSCSVDEELLPLTGEWKLTLQSGGFWGGQFEVPEDLILYIQGNDVLVYENDSIVFKAKMKITRGKYFNTICFDKNLSNTDGTFRLGRTKELGFLVEENTLLFYDQCADCFSYHFERI